MWSVTAMRRAVRAKYANALRAAGGNPHVVVQDGKECLAAIDWLSGYPTVIDFKVESRQHDGAWRHVLYAGVMGYSASLPLVEIKG